MVLDLPFDITTNELEAGTNKHTGKTTNAVDIEISSDSSGVNNDKETNELINSIILKIRSTNPSKLKELAEDIILYEVQEYANQQGLTVGDLAKKASSNSLSDEFYKQIDWWTKSSRNGFNVPVLLGTHIRSPVAKHVRIFGAGGQNIARTIVNTQVERERKGNEDYDSILRAFIDQTITRSAAGFDDGINISSANLDENRTAMLKITQGIADQGNDFIRAFPVFRLYFIDFRGPKVVVKDNFYGYNAIESIQITHDKHDSSLAVIRLADPFHMLQGETSGVNDRNTSVIDNEVIASANRDLNSKNILSRITLRQGRAIQIRGGYSSEPDNLDILFTGRIAEIQFGDIVTIVAQDWKSELISKQVEFELNSNDNLSVKDLIVRTIRDANPSGIGEVYTREETKQLNKIRNKLSAEGIIQQSFIQRSGTVGGSSGAAGFSGFTLFGFNFLDGIGAGLDLRLKNIWIPDKDPQKFKLFSSITDTGWDGHRWAIPLTSAWDVLQKATNYTWGYVCQVVPYDGQATLFFGRPDQLYYHTNGDNRRARQYKRTRLEALTTITSSFSIVFNDFVRSKYFKNALTENIIAIDPLTRQFAFTDTVDGNLIYDKFRVTTSNRASIIVEPEDSSYLTYKKIISAPVSNGQRFNPNVANIIDPVKLNYAADFTTYYEKLKSNVLGDYDRQAAVMLLSSFYGLSPRYLESSMQVDIGLVFRDLFIKPITPQGLAELKQLLADGLRPLSTVPKLPEDVDISPQTLSLVSATIDKLTDFASSLRLARSISGDGYFIPLPFSPNPPKEHEELAFALRAYWQITNQGSNPEVRIEVLPEGITATKSLLLTKDRFNQTGPFFSDVSQLLRAAKRFADEFSTTRLPDAFLKSTFSEDLSSRLGNRNLITNDLSDTDKLVDAIIDNLHLFRAYVYFFSEFSSDPDSELGSEGYKKAKETLQLSHYFNWPNALNMKVFRDFHYVMNSRDIIQNNLAATTREMYNTVVIRHPEDLDTTNEALFDLPSLFGNTDDFNSIQVTSETEWTTWPSPDRGHIGLQYNDTITYEDKKIAVLTDLNIRRKDQAAKVGLNYLAKVMKPMYRNNILLMGRSIKPHDHVIVNDKYNDIYGPVDVERVVHHYSITDGWTTNIIPHAVCEANPGAKVIQDAIFSSTMDKIYDIVDFSFWTIAIGASFATGGAAGAVAFPVRKALTEAFRRSARAYSTVGIAGTRAGFSGAARVLSTRLTQQLTNRGLLTEKVNILKRTLGSTSTALAKGYLAKEAGKFISGEISRLVHINSGAGDVSLPVVFTPVLFKGVPLQAGLKGTESYYWSLGSKLHWAYRDTVDGFFDLLTIARNAFEPEETEAGRIFTNLQTLQPNDNR
jgi:hypothetical protein